MDFKEVIKRYLDDFASKDETFAAKYENEKKSIDGCVKYINGQVYKMRKNGEQCLALTDDEVFGMAIHYYDEEDIEVNEAPVNVTVATSDVKPEPKKRTRKKKAEVVDLNGISVEVGSDDTDVEFPVF